ncbi:MAG TPA: peptidoglycan DD-metalloendopeptidase family protein [Burkholderiales bacterium]|nr:peptidoglycan DD-metalloendopeptidase family protein [Burkholderiales bacterium]
MNLRILKCVLVGALAAVVAAGCAVKTGAPVIDRSADARAAGAKPGAAAKPKPGAATTPAPRPTDARPEFHTVRKGDTLYSIALDYGLDYRELAQWNEVTATSVISIGQQLRLSPPRASAAPTAVPLQSAPIVQGRPLDGGPIAGGDGTIKSQPQAVRAPYTDQTYAQMASLKPEPSPRDAPRAPSGPGGEESVAWGWPASGKVVGTFSDSANQRGIRIAGKLGQPVLASAAGRVIFSGTGIRGFGKLIVIKHNNTYLSVYAHNSELLVKEGQNVAKGQKIAEMGSTDADQVRLHFEIRRLGKPVDPMKLLPPA